MKKMTLLFSFLLGLQTSLAFEVSGKILVQTLSDRVNFDLSAILEDGKYVLKGGTVNSISVSGAQSFDGVKNYVERTGAEKSFFQQKGVVLYGSSLTVSAIFSGIAFQEKINLSNTRSKAPGLDHISRDQCEFILRNQKLSLKKNVCQWGKSEFHGTDLVRKYDDKIKINMTIDDLNYVGQFAVKKVKERTSSFAQSRATVSALLAVGKVQASSSKTTTDAKKVKSLKVFYAFLQIFGKKILGE